MTEQNPDDLIEATIRRVAEAKARRDGQIPPVELAPAHVDAGPPPEASEPESPIDVDESLIEATIRRVAAAKAAQAGASEIEPDRGAEVDAPLRDDIQDPAPNVAPETERVAHSSMSETVTTLPTVAHATVQAAPWAEAMSRLEQELADVRRALESLSARVDAAIPPGQPAASVVPQTVVDDDDDWDDSPVMQTIPAGAPRPAIFRNPAPARPASSERLVLADADEAEIDIRPLPQPLPPIHAEPRRGLDLLPRTYRITVEDKRRGVDLVPLHRALLGMEGVRDMSLLSFANGVAIVSLETVEELDPEVLGQSVSHAMSRPANVEVHNEQTMVVKLAEE